MLKKVKVYVVDDEKMIDAMLVKERWISDVEAGSVVLIIDELLYIGQECEEKPKIRIHNMFSHEIVMSPGRLELFMDRMARNGVDVEDETLKAAVKASEEKYWSYTSSIR